MKFYDTSLEEQETNINIDYLTKEAHLYTSRKTIYNRYKKTLGEPTQTYYTNKKISGAKWVIPFHDKKINNLFSKTILIGGL